jgi:hypothetical protein
MMIANGKGIEFEKIMIQETLCNTVSHPPTQMYQQVKVHRLGIVMRE